MKRKLPKVNRRLANQILEEEEAETEKKEEDINKTKKASKKKKGLNSEIFQDERFANMFKNEVRSIVRRSFSILFSTFLLLICPSQQLLQTKMEGKKIQGFILSSRRGHKQIFNYICKCLLVKWG